MTDEELQNELRTWAQGLAPPITCHEIEALEIGLSRNGGGRERIFRARPILLELHSTGEVQLDAEAERWLSAVLRGEA